MKEADVLFPLRSGQMQRIFGESTVDRVLGRLVVVPVWRFRCVWFSFWFLVAVFVVIENGPSSAEGNGPTWLTMVPMRISNIGKKVKNR